MSLPISIWLLLALFGLAMASAFSAAILEVQRRRYIRRAHGPGALGTRGRAEDAGPRLTVPKLLRPLQQIGGAVPRALFDGVGLPRALERAGLEHPAAPLLYAGVHVIWSGLILLLGITLAPRTDVRLYTITLALAILLGAFAPRAVLDRWIAVRQHRIRLGVPDALDLLVVCIEAGTALDASLQRVARELRAMHPALADELVAMTRRMSAGMSRADALSLLHERTGVAELRALATHLIQSERWGTSVANVLRVYARDLRRRRRLVAEKRAATAGTRMLLPLALFIFPTIFIVILGPAILQITAAFRNMSR